MDLSDPDDTQRRDGSSPLAWHDALALHLNLNRRFHFAIYEACAMPLLVSMIETLWLQIGPLFRSLSIPLLGRDLPDYHRLAVKALGDRDAHAAAEAIRNDIASAAAVILAKLDDATNGREARAAPP